MFTHHVIYRILNGSMNSGKKKIPNALRAALALGVEIPMTERKKNVTVSQCYGSKMSF